MSGRFEVGTAASVRAYHVMPGLPPPEGERHAHRYRVEVVVGRAGLDERGMVCDLDVLNEALGSLAALLSDADLDAVIGPDAGGPVTVEAFARWVHRRLADPVGAGGGQDLAVRVWETEVAFGGYGAPLGPTPLGDGDPTAPEGLGGPGPAGAA